MKLLKQAVWILITAAIVGCAPRYNSGAASHENLVAYMVDREADAVDTWPAVDYAPVFLVHDQHEKFNRIGTPASRTDSDGGEEVYVDSSAPTVYFARQDFSTPHGVYWNYIYRIHFERVPYPHLTAGKNVGLIVVLTFNEDGKPVLITTVHTCGCFLAFLPTSHLDSAAYPQGWDTENQEVYGVSLPGLLDLTEHPELPPPLQVVVQGGNHRIVDILLAKNEESYPFVNMALRPMADLQKILHGDSVTSFFETAGRRKGYVKNAQKWLERMLISWWALDLHVGEDKMLGPPEETGVVFYTSLKPWARKDSDMWHFADFLRYWGWSL